jgi:hypothetical protein
MLRCRRRDASQALPTVPGKQIRVVLRLPLLMPARPGNRRGEP